MNDKKEQNINENNSGSSQDEKINKSQNAWITDGILIALFTGFSYMVAFTYEAGYASFYNIPWHLISMSITNILICLMIIFAVAFITFNTINSIWIILPVPDRPIKYFIRRFLIFLMILFIPTLLFFNKFLYWLISICLAIFLGLFEFLFPLFSQKDKASYEAKLVAQANYDYEEGKRLLWHSIDKRYGRFLVNALIFGFIALSSAYCLGFKNASEKTSYYIFVSSPERVVLAIYGDTIISAPFNRKTREIEPQLWVSKISENNNIIMQSEKVGKLHLKPSSKTAK